MHRIKIHAVLISIPLWALAASPALAGLGYTLTATVERADRIERFGEHILTIDDDARIDFLDPDGNPDGSYLVTNDGGKRFALIEGSEALCSDWTTAEFFAAAGKALDKGSRLANAKLKDISVEKVFEQPGGIIEGHETSHVRLNIKYGAKVRILLFTADYEVQEVDDLWMTGDLQLPSFERKWLDATAQTGFDYIDQIFAQRTAFETGPVLRYENVVTLRNVKNGEEEVKKEVVLVSDLRKITRDDIPPGHFDLPQCEPVSKKRMRKESMRMLKKHIR